MSDAPAEVGKALESGREPNRVKRLISSYAPFIQSPPPRFRTESGAAVHGMMAEYATVPEIYHAAEKIRDAGYRDWDVFASFPIHGIDEAMGVKRTILPLIVAGGGFTGAILGYLMQWFISGYDYPLMKQGKPYAAWEPFLPVTFEMGVLFAAFSALIGMLALNGLPRWNHPLLATKSFLKVSDDKLVICIESVDPQFHPERTRDLLRDTGATKLELIEEDG
ncbi:MAG: DUF3341 domain-containing protein [Planctomycetota bacterium]